MRAIILAAGIGKRLASTKYAGRPKCLLRFGGKSLLQRTIESLNSLGVDDIVIVVGYKANLVEAELDTLNLSNRPRTVINPDFRQGSLVSLWCAREYLQGDILLMDADVLYHPDILKKLVRSAHGNAFLLDRDYGNAEEAVKLCVRNGVLVEFRKKVPPGLRYEFAGESVGFFRFSEPMAGALARCCREYMAAGKAEEPHEEAIRDLLLATPDQFSYEDVTGLPWIEMDFPEDIERAERDVLPKIP